MSSPKGLRRLALRWWRFLLLAGVAGWGIWSGWQLYQARRAGIALRTALQREAMPAAGWAAARGGVTAAADQLGRGRFGEAARTLSPALGLTASQRDAARRFLGRQETLRQRLIAAATVAEKRQLEGDDVTASREALARVLEAAADSDSTAVVLQLEAAEAALDRVPSGTRGPAWPADEAGVAARTVALEPAVRAGQELMTESFAAAGRLIGKAAWHCRSGRYDEAAELLDLAAELLEVSPVPSETKQVPTWFLDLAQAPSSTADATDARAAVELAEAAARAESPGPAVTGLVHRARREFDTNQIAEADWWASVALAALAMDSRAAEEQEEESEP